MKILKKAGTLFSIGVLCLALNLGTASAASTESEVVHNPDVNGVAGLDLNKYFEDNNIPAEKQTILLSKVENNELWDAYKPESLSLLPDDFYSFNFFDGSQTKYYRFDDGSFMSVGVEVGGSQLVKGDHANKGDSSLISPLGSWNHGDYIDVWDYKVSKAVGTASAYYYADFEVGLPGTRKSRITNLYGANASGFGVTGTPSTEIVREYEDPGRSRSALARSYWYSQANLSFSWEYGVVGGGAETTIGTTCSLWLGVINGQIFVDSRVPYI
ncbi:hypothetical protein DFP94_10651 [Fontibacillus phaseoli]|uniref:Uncharacterized protein n=1 Tax=Fontibacillus phaseoli TaxID=1416533 RepID=A0A369BAF9_9BACL|nr:hypothetical protein [Fontibacillus phaseoli]RCX18519.1 hypothetical protein DFP94_10651 [Fontibacillus phaseoli]